MRDLQPVLLVEDDIVDAMTVKRAFKELAIPNQIIHKTNGEEAIAFLNDSQQPRPGIILLDLNMPRMNGIEFLESVKNKSEIKSIPIVVLTTSSEYIDRKYSFENHIAGYMVKPANYNDFVNMMKTISNYWNSSEMP